MIEELTATRNLNQLVTSGLLDAVGQMCPKLGTPARSTWRREARRCSMVSEGLIVMAGPTGGLSTSFVVDGQRFGGEPLRWAWGGAIGGMFTADAEAVGRILPSLLHPLRVSRRRTVMTVGGAEVEWRLGPKLTFRSLDIQVIAMVTGGAKPAPPLLPLAGLMADRGWAAYGAGFMPLLLVTSNRVAAELYRGLLGWPAVVADVSREELPGMTRYVSTGDSGDVLVDVVARSGMPAQEFREAQPMYGVRDGQLFRATLSGRGVGGDTTGRAVAFLALGEHPAVQGLAGIGIRQRGWSSNHCHEFDQEVKGPVTVLGPTQAPAAPAATGGVTGEAVVSDHPTQRVALDQGLTRLPFDPAGGFGTAEPAGEPVA